MSRWIDIDDISLLKTVDDLKIVEDEPQMDYERGRQDAWDIAQKVFDSTVTLYEAEDVAKQIDKDTNVRCKPNDCKYAVNPSGDVWECGCCLEIFCEHQIYDRNPDGTLNIVECGFEPKTEPQTERSE